MLSESKRKSWSRLELTKMLYQSFVGTLADNAIEIGWILCFSLLADKILVEKITILFGVNDAFWVVLSLTYYAAKTSLSATLPRLLEEHGIEVESKVVKNHIYIFYLMLFPMALGSWVFLPDLLSLLGVAKEDFPMYIPYFRISIISILVFAPWSVFIPAYYRSKGKTKEAAILDHLNAWCMIIGIFITTHIFHYGVNVALIVNMFANGIPLYYFLWQKPIKGFFAKGFEFSMLEVSRAWNLMKWEVLRKLAPRLATILGVTLMINVNPVYVGIKYWVLNLFMFVSGWVSALSDLLNTHISRNIGLGEKNPNKDNEYLYKKALMGVLISLVVIYVLVRYCLVFLPLDIYEGLINKYIYLIVFFEFMFNLRCYMYFSIARTYKPKLNGILQVSYLLPSIFLRPLLIWYFLYVLDLGLISIFLDAALVSLLQYMIFSTVFKRKLLS